MGTRTEFDFSTGEARPINTPAYMFDDARLSDVFAGIDGCVAEVLKRV